MTAERNRLTSGTLWLLFLLLCLGLGARLFGWNWDESSGQHPDERHVLMCSSALSWPKSFADYLNEADSPLNPRNRGAHFYAYGTLPGTLLRGVMELGGITRADQMAATGRLLSTFADTMVIGLVFALAWTLYRRSSIALLAAFLYAMAVLPIQQAHYFVVDPFANFFVALTLVLLALAWRGGKLWQYAVTGVALGLALSCKISVATFGLPVALVALIPAAGEHLGIWKLFCRAALRTTVFSLAVLVTVRLALPDAFSGLWPWQLAPRWLANMQEVVNISTGVIDIPFTRQFYGRIPLLWPWWNMVVWGMGLGLGLSAWAGWLAAAWKLIRNRAWIHAVPVICVATVFFHQGFTYQATLRYFLPIYGCLCVLASWVLISLMSCSGEQEKRRWVLRAGRIPLVVAVSFTMAWALAFLSIYTKPHTRVEASRWIYDHIPNGRTLACEHWDDFLPLPLDAKRGPDRYKQIELPLYVADNMEKRGELLAKLNNADYIIIASQKLRDSIPRMPHRYPFTISYYKGLEDGSLGFDRVAEFKRSMNFLGYSLSTRSAEEAFSVYDHPPVTIYRKTPRYNPEALVVRFNSIPLDGVTDTREPVKPQPRSLQQNNKWRSRTIDQGKPESAILLSPERWAAAQKEGTWRDMFDRKSLQARFPVTVWVFHLILLQLAGWALLGPLLRKLPDRGAALAKPFALLIPCWILWLLASTGLARHDRSSYWLIFGGFALLGFWTAWIFRSDWKEWWKNGVADALRVEMVFWVAFFFFVLVRAGNPDLWHASWGGEKPMEMTFLYGVIRSEAFPPMNPWFAGGFINYYYFCFVLCGTLIKALGVLPEVGFNLCLATFFAFACAATASVARALSKGKTWSTAWFATALVMVLGNLFQIRFIWKQLLRLGRPDHELTFPLLSDGIRALYGLVHFYRGERLAPYDADLYWVAARAISGEDVAPVTEFPYWSFLYGDLHPHLMALPYTLCVILLLVAWIRSSGAKVRTGLAFLIALTLGFFWPANTWDWPTYGALSGLVIFLTLWQKDASTLKGFILALGKALGVFFAMILFGYLAFLPYHRSYVAGYGSFELWKGPQTTLCDYFFIYGLFLFILASAAVVAWKQGDLNFVRGLRLWAGVLKSCLKRKLAFSRQRLFRLGLAKPESMAGALAALLLFVFALTAVLRFSLVPVLLAGITLSVLVVWNLRRDPLRAVPALFTLLAFSLSLAVEWVVLVGDIGRMNTVFKFYYQVWVFFALASALALPALLSSWKGWIPRLKRLWMLVFLILLFAAALYPLLATPAKIRDRFATIPPTLDGLAFAENTEYTLKGVRFSLRTDLHAIRWLQDTVSGSPVILEMNTGNILYSWGSRFSIHTGLPSVVGWNWHQRQQQAGVKNSRVDIRVSDVEKIYRTADPEVARQLMTKYGVKLVIIGEVERILGTPEGLQKFETMGLSKIYDQEGVQIYSVPEEEAVRRE